MIKLTQTLKIKLEYSRSESIPLSKNSDINIIENSEYVASEITIRNDVYARSLKANNKANKINVLINRTFEIWNIFSKKIISSITLFYQLIQRSSVQSGNSAVKVGRSTVLILFSLGFVLLCNYLLF